MTAKAVEDRGKHGNRFRAFLLSHRLGGFVLIFAFFLALGLGIDAFFDAIGFGTSDPLIESIVDALVMAGFVYLAVRVGQAPPPGVGNDDAHSDSTSSDRIES